MRPEASMKRPNLDSACEFLVECHRREISVTPDRENWRVHLRGPTHNAGWVEDNHHLKADILAFMTGSPELYLDSECDL